MSRLIDADALIAELNNSHFPGAPYVDAGISIAIGKVCDAPTIEPEPKWIPVSERLPESRVYVLVTYEYQYGLIDHGISWYEDKRKEWMSTREVTAWMPLPEPYREEGEQE